MQDVAAARSGDRDASVEVRRSCRLCGFAALAPIFDLGKQFIAGAFFKGDVTDGRFLRSYPLELVRCDTASRPEACGLVQLRHTVPRELLFSHYGYRSGVNETMRNNLRDIARKAELTTRPGPGDVVVDIGCNDGTLLMAYGTAGLDRVGIDPAEDVTRYARAAGLEVCSEFFSRDVYERLRPGRPASIVTSIAMFYDLADPLGFARDVAAILRPDGLWVLELSWIVAMIRMASFDTVCHEHLEYYSLRQIEWILDRAGLAVHDVEVNGINGGSLRIFVRPAAAGPVPMENAMRIDRIRDAERELAIGTAEPYREFARRAEAIRHDLRELLLELRSINRSVYVYGASTKGNVILQYCGIDTSLVIAAADRNPDKWGAHMLGTNVPIISENDARAARPDYFLVLPYHFLDEFVRRESEFLERGGRFIIPIPEVRLVGREGTRSIRG